MNRRALLGAALAAPFHRRKRHQVTQPWSNQAVSLVVIQASPGAFTGLFVYSPSPGPGNLIASIAAGGGTDPYGNKYPAGISTQSGGIEAILTGNELAWDAPADHPSNLPAMFAAPSAAIGNSLEITTGTGGGGVTAGALTLYDSHASSTVPAIPSGSPGIFVAGGCPLVTDTAHAVSFQNGWSNSGSGPNMTYRFNPANGMVELVGDMNAGTLTSPTTIFTLPAAYRPANTHWITPIASGGGAGLTAGTSRFQINPTGTVTAVGMAAFTAGGRLFLRYSMDPNA